MESLSRSSSSLPRTPPSTSTNGADQLGMISSRCTFCRETVVKRLLCSRCKMSYCSATCQRKDWKAHKTTCKVYYPPTDPNSKTLELPSEILTRILSHLFSVPSLRLTATNGPASPYACPFSATSLLLVSHTFSALVLPHLYHTLTLSRPSHYTTFFNPYRGLLIAGPSASLLWSYVQKIVFVAGVKPPIDPKSKTEEYIVPLDYPVSGKGARIREIEVLPRPRKEEEEEEEEEEEGEQWLADPEARQLLDRITNDPREREDAVTTLTEQHVAAAFTHPDGTPYALEEWVAHTWGTSDWEAAVDASIAKEVGELVAEEREAFFDDLVFATSPRTVRVSSPARVEDRVLKDACPPDGAVPVETLVVQFDESVEGADNVWEDLYVYAQQVGVSCGVAHAHLVGFDRGQRDGFVEHVGWRAKSARPDWIERWTWDEEDETRGVLEITENIRVKFEPPAPTEP